MINMPESRSRRGFTWHRRIIAIRSVRRANKVSILERDVVLGEVNDLNKPQALLWSIESQANTVLGEVYSDRLGDWAIGGVEDIELRESLRLSLEACQNIV